MIENATTLTLDHPRERVFDFLTDFRNEPAWNPDCSGVEMLSPAPVGKGSTYRGHFRGMGNVTVGLTATNDPIGSPPASRHAWPPATSSSC